MADFFKCTLMTTNCVWFKQCWIRLLKKAISIIRHPGMRTDNKIDKNFWLDCDIKLFFIKIYPAKIKHHLLLSICVNFLYILNLASNSEHLRKPETSCTLKIIVLICQTSIHSILPYSAVLDNYGIANKSYRTTSKITYSNQYSAEPVRDSALKHVQ